MIELRQNVGGNYKGYIYASSLNEAQKIMNKIKNDINIQNINLDKIEIKHGCTEFYAEHSLYKNIDRNVTDEIYKKEWNEIEKI